jgi:hypothetical protein
MMPGIDTGGTKKIATVDPDAFPRLGPEWQSFCQKISEANLDDRSRWSEPINGDPVAAFRQALNG